MFENSGKVNNKRNGGIATSHELLLEANNIKKVYGERILFELKDFKVYSADKIGIVGLNGAGKTTLINILAGVEKDYEGDVKLFGSMAYIEQLGDIKEAAISKENLSKFKVSGINRETMSGGEKTKLKIASSLTGEKHILFADEPTCNLDIKAIAQLEKRLQAIRGAIILISHDKSLLNNVCNKIIEIEDGKIQTYIGNYSDYQLQKQEEIERKEYEYDQYVKEKKRLTQAMIQKSQKSKSLNKTPKRMGISEARLHRRAVGRSKGKLEKAAKAIQSRIDNIEKKEKPKTYKETQITLPDHLKIHSKNIVSIKYVTKRFDDNHLFIGKNITIKNNTKTALLGDNGTGKTTLLKMIINREQGIVIPPAIKFGYFKQDLENLDENKTILENVMENTAYKEQDVRTILGRLLFRREEVLKKVALLSGGERVKVSFAKVFLSDINVLILDEPTNYLDIKSRQALLNVLNSYDGAVIFVSHDRKFIKEVAEELLIIEDKVIKCFQGKYQHYININKKGDNKHIEEKKIEEEIMKLENLKNNLIGKLSIPSKNDNIEELDREYIEVLSKLRKLKC